jgi:diguanylate cyclase (GGDEF)-like protein
LRINDGAAPSDFSETNISIEKIAEKALESFFNDLIHEQWERSYRKLTAADSSNVSLDEYIEWKEAVTHLYKLGNYKIQYYSCYNNCEYAGKTFPQILHFAVDLTEMEVFSGKVNQEQTQKYVALDKGEWKVCLGYADLKPSIRRFQYLAQVLPKINSDDIIKKALDNIDPLTGNLSRKGFTKEAEKEFQRSKRYGNPIALAVVDIRPSEGREDDFDEEKDMLVSHVSEALSCNIRNTDIIGRCTDTALGILFIETQLESAKATLLRLLELIEISEGLNYEIYWAISALENDDIDLLLQDTLDKAVLIERVNALKRQSQRIGKYRLSDILDFNKRGRNHF